MWWESGLLKHITKEQYNMILQSWQPVPDSEVVGVTEATGIGGIDALEKEL